MNIPVTLLFTYSMHTVITVTHTAFLFHWPSSIASRLHCCVIVGFGVSASEVLLCCRCLFWPTHKVHSKDPVDTWSSKVLQNLPMRPAPAGFVEVWPCLFIIQHFLHLNHACYAGPTRSLRPLDNGSFSLAELRRNCCCWFLRGVSLKVGFVPPSDQRYGLFFWACMLWMCCMSNECS